MTLAQLIATMPPSERAGAFMLPVLVVIATLLVVAFTGEI